MKKHTNQQRFSRADQASMDAFARESTGFPEWKSAKLLWNKGAWWVRYAGPGDKKKVRRLKAKRYRQAYNEAAEFLGRHTDAAWVIA
jgi:hypothetical protein